MEYTLQEYKRCTGKVYTTTDGHKYIKSKMTDSHIYLRCVFFKSMKCKATCKLSRDTNLVNPLQGQHNHSDTEYDTHIYELKTKCKTISKYSQSNLRQIFNDVTRNDPSACDISFPQCESSMYRARRTLQPIIPQTASEFSDLLPTTTFGEYYKFSVRCGDDVGVVFYSDQMGTLLSEISNIQFDGTFYTVPIQFYQLSTIFVAVEKHSLPAIHCLMTGKSQDLYQAVFETISTKLPHFKPLASMSDWEPAARNAIREVFPHIHVYGCWFHFAQRIWMKTQKLGLSQGFRINHKITSYIKQLMAIPFLPSSLINPSFGFLQIPTLEQTDMVKLETLKKYFQKRWLTRIKPEELSIYELNITTNNSAESYHSKLKSIIKTGHPRIWTFVNTLNELIQDTDNDIGRLRQGREINRPRKKKNINIEEQRNLLKQKLRDGKCTPWEYLESISHTIGNRKFQDNFLSSDSEPEGESDEIDTTENKCIVCLSLRTTTWIFMPCRHACCCRECSERLEELEQPCPVCRSTVQSRFQIFLE